MILKIEDLKIFFKAGEKTLFRLPYIEVQLILEGNKRAYYHTFQKAKNILPLLTVSHIELCENQLSSLEKALVKPKFLKYI